MIAIRNARPSENALLAEFGARTFAENFAPQNAPENMSAYLAEAFNPRRQAQELADPAGVFLLAEIDGELAGYAHLHSGPPDIETDASAAKAWPYAHSIELVRIYADSAWIGKGVGPALMQACLDEARQRGCDLLWLGVWEHNPRAQAFYQKWGFEKIGSHTFRLGDDLQTDWIMARLLS